MSRHFRDSICTMILLFCFALNMYEVVYAKAVNKLVDGGGANHGKTRYRLSCVSLDLHPSRSYTRVAPHCYLAGADCNRNSYTRTLSLLIQSQAGIFLSYLTF
ncbi:hypothetical protein P171DRAFT_235468 [Karstenula rhodostoma CBS 690.94]|uniref:Secreted protein n=1 Tax=Karstenula rhodostoma CBS 690.94 TaxID=1392251 RepID=A0A9P4PPP7_9PLEO|nr:hypothetical protein P171DRAFT_235468 [Karstenula rhodostoma CBS 690.94]